MKLFYKTNTSSIIPHDTTTHTKINNILETSHDRLNPLSEIKIIKKTESDRIH